MPRINLLPHREEARRVKRREFMIALGAAVLAGFLVSGLGKLLYASWINDQTAKNDLLKREIGKLDSQITDILDLENRKQRLLARMDIIDKLQRSRPEIVHLLDELMRTVPEGVYLTSISQSGKKIELHGIAQSSTRVSTYMRNIDASTRLANPELQVVEAAPNSPTGGSSFTLTATTPSVDLDDVARSGKAKGAAK
jgi:type IV pilus assembly protein PilN